MSAQKILVIDDEPDAIQLMQDFLSERGYAVIYARDGEEGLNRFDTEKPDLIICDIKMPKMDGFRFLKELRTGRMWVPVIIISALTEPANILKSYNLEADYYVPKPIELDNLLKAIQIMISLIPLRKK
jgi:two-component system, OmpR family, response regulator TrcR